MECFYIQYLTNSYSTNCKQGLARVGSRSREGIIPDPPPLFFSCSSDIQKGKKKKESCAPPGNQPHIPSQTKPPKKEKQEVRKEKIFFDDARTRKQEGTKRESSVIRTSR